MKKTLFITTLLLSAGAMFTSCNKDVENPDMQAQPEETAQVTRAYGDKTPLIEVYYEINDTNPLNAFVVRDERQEIHRSRTAFRFEYPERREW